jgi:hypothetical protein
MSLSFSSAGIYLTGSGADPLVRAGPPGPALSPTKSGRETTVSRRGRRLRTRGSAPLHSPVSGKLSGIGLSVCSAETRLGVGRVEMSLDPARKSARATGRVQLSAIPIVGARQFCAAWLGISYASVVGTRAGPTAKILALRINCPLGIPAKIAVVLDAHVPASALVLDHHAKESRQPGIRASALLIVVL